MISAVVINFNQAKELDNCLESIRNFAQEIVVIDLGSKDSSKEVIKKNGAKFLTHKLVSYVEMLRNYAISKVSGDWVLVLDPDEKISESLIQKLKVVIKEDNYTAVNIPRKNIFFGKWIKHTNWWPDRHIRFFKNGKVKWGNKIHSYPEVNGRILNLEAKEDLSIIHFGYDQVSQFMERQNRYSTIEAENLYKSGIRFSWWLFFWKPQREFLVRFIRHGGFLDGFYGFMLTFLMVIYQLEVMVKLWELENL